MSVEQMKAALKKAYQGNSWAQKVDLMSDKQTFATYNRLLNAKKL